MGGPGYVDGDQRDEFDNFYPCARLEKDGIHYVSVENFFQAHKTLDPAEHRRIVRSKF